MGLRGIGAVTRKKLEKKPRREAKADWEKETERWRRVLAFVEALPVTKGILAGSKMALLPDQVEFIRSVYAERPDGRRATSLAIKSEPKGNGKTGLTAALALCHLLGPESEPRGEVYSAAIDRGQAAIMFAEMEAIISQVESFKKRVNVVRFHKKMEVMRGHGERSIYTALSADARSAHGLAPSLWIYDELAQAKSRELLDNLMQGMSKRKEALGIVISTQAATDEHPLSQLIDDALEGNDPSTFLQLHAAPEEADPWDPETWKACNPAWGHFLDPEDFAKAADRARRMAPFEPAFRNLRLNQRIDINESVGLIDAATWRLGAAVPSSLDGRPCYGGLDLSGKHDLTAFVLAFPGNAGGVDVLPFFWTPLEQLEARKPAERDIFRQWIKQGHLIGVPGKVIDYRFVAQEIAKLSERFDIRKIAFDRWRMDYFKPELDELGCAVVLEEFGQGFKGPMTEAIETLSAKAGAGKIRHGDHPVLAASVLQAAIVTDPADCKKFDKRKTSKAATVRIDGAVALAMAIGIASFKVHDIARELDRAIMQRGGFA